jgi:hypothetical protein
VIRESLGGEGYVHKRLRPDGTYERYTPQLPTFSEEFKAEIRLIAKLEAARIKESWKQKLLRMPTNEFVN